MRLLSAALCTTVAAALLAGCSGGNGSSPGASTPGGTMPQGLKSHGRIAMTTVPKQFLHVGVHRKIHLSSSYTRGIAAAAFFATSNNVAIYPKNNSADGPPVCYESTEDNINDLDSDSSGDLIVPNAFDGVDVYAPPFSGEGCGTLLGTITDAYGQASSAAAIDAVNGTIVVGNIEGGSADGVVTCTLSSLTCHPLSAPGLIETAGVAMDKAGNCYADGINSADVGELWVFTGCAGTGVEASGFNPQGYYYGGIDFDNRGNLVAVSLLAKSFELPSTVASYSGCSTGTCTQITGPTDLTGEVVFGHVGRQNERFVVGDVEDALISVYSYSPSTGLGSLLYSFNNGLDCSSDECESAAYLPNGQR